MEYQDTYFYEGEEALKIASLENRFSNKTKLQICYYQGKKLNSNLKNLIYLPIEDIDATLPDLHTRIPTNLIFDGTLIPQQEIKLRANDIMEKMSLALLRRNQRNKEQINKFKCAKIDFKEPLRFYLASHDTSSVVQHVKNNIVRALKKKGYEVYYKLYNGCEDMSDIKEICDFNPHCIISIDNINNSFLNDSVFNFVWYQDRVPEISNNKPLDLRKRDYIYHLNSGFQELLKVKGVVSTYQPFCIDTDVYKLRANIKRKDKIVFIGSSYKSQFDMIINENKYKCLEEIWELYLLKGDLSEKSFFEFIEKYNMQEVEVGCIINYVHRDKTLEYLVQMNLSYPIEVYGKGWERNIIIKPLYKGILSYGSELSKVYNSAKYSFVIGGYILQQRVFESTASGTIPLVFDPYILDQDEKSEKFADNMLFFRRLDDVPALLKSTKVLKLQEFANSYSYETFINDMIKIIRKNI